MIKKSMMGLALAATTMYAAEVGFSGYILGGTGSSIDSEDYTITTNVYHEIDLTTSVKFSEKVSVDVFTTMTSTDDDGEEARWDDVDFDGVTLNWELDFGTLMVGDLVYASEGMTYYALKRSSTVLQETFVRGFGLSAGAATIYWGSLDTDPTKNGLYASYAIEAGDFKATPYVAASLSDTIPVTAGVDLSLSAGAFGLKSSIGVHTYPDLDATPVFTIDPSYDAGSFNVLASFYMAMLGDNPAGLDQLPTDEEMFLYVEPGAPISDVFSVGLPLEYHAGEKDTDSETFDVYPTAYFSVADDASFLIWAGVSNPIGDANKDNDASLLFGTELTASF
jgi:hypothetical protein